MVLKLEFEGKNDWVVKDQLSFLALLWWLKKCFSHGQTYPVVMTATGYPILMQGRFITLQQHNESYFVISLELCLPCVQILHALWTWLKHFHMLLFNFSLNTAFQSIGRVSCSASILNWRENSRVKLEYCWKEVVKKNGSTVVVTIN